MIPSGKEILFTRQRHEADKAGLHYDVRLVLDDKAYSWATKKDIPEPGKAIILWEQPVHTSHYALSEKVVIPKGSYGAGTTTLDFVRKAKVGSDSSADQFTFSSGQDRFLVKRLPADKYGKKAWLFKNLGSDKKADMNKYLEKIAENQKKKSKGYLPAAGAYLGASTLVGAASVPAALKGLSHTGDSAAKDVRSFLRKNNLSGKVTFSNKDAKLDKFHVPAEVRQHLGSKNPFAAPLPGNKFVIAGKRIEEGGKLGNADVMLHELGHAKDFSTGATRLKRIGAFANRHPIGNTSFGVATIGALSNEKTRDYAPAIAAVPGVLKMREEMAANRHAIKHLAATKGSAAAKNFTKGFARHNMMSYGAAVLAPVAGTYAAKKVLDHYSKKNKYLEKASTLLRNLV